MGLLNSDDGKSTWSRTPVYKFQKGQINDSIDDPTYLGFIFLFHFDNPLNLGDGTGSSPLLGHEDQEGSACNYLKRNKEFARLSYLKSFIKLLKQINTELPWYWQSFTGGESFVKYNNFDDPYLGGEDTKIEITCLESIDLRITALMDLYRNAVYDLEYRRVVIPVNLRKFCVDIYIQEVRKFHISRVSMLNTFAQGTSLNIKNTQELTPSLIFQLKFCEFLADESNVPFSTLDMVHASSEYASQKLAFSYENLSIKNSYPNIDGGIVLDGNTVNLNSENDSIDGTKSKFAEAAGKMARDAAMTTAESAAAATENFATGKLNKLILGNVYGISPSTLTTKSVALATGSVFSLGPDIFNSLSNKKAESYPVKLGNVYE